MHAEMEKYYARNKFYLSRIGSWPYQHKVLKILLPCILIMVQFSFMATVILVLHDTWGDVDLAVESVITIIPIVGSNTKLFNIVVYNDKFRHLLQLMNDHWNAFSNKSDRCVLKYYAEIGQKVTKYYTAYCCTMVVLYLFIPLTPKILDIVRPLNESRPLKFICEVEYRVDKEKYYYPILMHVSLTTVITVGIILAIDTIYIICVLHACSLFTAISHRLKKIMGQINVKTNNNEKMRTRTHNHLLERYDAINDNCDDYRELIICLKKHQLALEYAQILNSTFTKATFVLLFLNVLIMSIIGLQVINKLGNTEEVVRYMTIAVGALTHLVCMCFPGQLLIDKSTEVFDKAYSSRWYTFSIKSRQLLKILLYRSLVPCTLSAGKMFIMSMTMFTTVMQTAMSYFTALGSIK
ncbi:Odorant receptor 114 [Nylanderia fulva]|uniref:Odorant receptor n=1 Tax=Nylanderia fulva TaxID=613905 RepID=A0A6G1LQ71_9HYME|nr:Odorant receptor 114 [Nylanderia fulva]